MSPLEVELQLLPGHDLPEALNALSSAGMPPVPGLRPVPMRGDAGLTWVVSVNAGLASADAQCTAALDGVARVVGVFGSPEGAPFQP